MTLSDPSDDKTSFGLLDCTSDRSQIFTYNTDTMEVKPEGNDNLCVAVAESSCTAGPFISRNLKLISCKTTNKTLIKWLMKPKVTAK